MQLDSRPLPPDLTAGIVEVYWLLRTGSACRNWERFLGGERWDCQVTRTGWHPTLLPVSALVRQGDTASPRYGSGRNKEFDGKCVGLL